MAAAGTTTSAVTALTCALEVYTIDAGALPGTSWYSQSIATKVDGGSSDSKASNY